MGTPENLPQHVPSKKPPKVSGFKRDFGMLKPSHSARFAPSASPTPNEREAEEESPVKYQHGSRPGPLGKPMQHKGNTKRDVRVAARALIGH